MKKTFKTFMIFVLTIVTCVAMLVPAFADNGASKGTIATVADAYNLAYDNDFIEIYDATLVKDGIEQEIYYIACRGLDVTGFNPKNPRGYYNAIKAILSNDKNTYVMRAATAILENCESGANLVFVGHSLGGMIVQQLISQKTIKNNYEILYSLAIGDPYILTKYSKEGTLIRVVDELDPVPYFSILGLANPYIGNVNYEKSGEILKAHFSYGSECWEKYDCLGYENGNAKIELIDCVFDGTI